MTIADQDLNADIPSHPGRPLTEEEFIEWSGDFWAEWVDRQVITLIDGVDREHALLHSFLTAAIGIFLEERNLGVILGTPFQVRLAPQRRRRAPDIMFVATARADIIKKHHIEGSPNLIVEIVSPESEARDWREKYHEYESAGVREYWVINPTSGKTAAYAFTNNRYNEIPVTDGKIASAVLPGFHIRPAWILAQPLPRVRDALHDMGL